MDLQIVTAPQDYPVTIAQAREHCRISGTADDAYLLALIATATAQCEHKTGLRLVTQTWDVLYDWLLDDVIDLPLSPLASVTHIKYYDTSGTLQTLSSAAYIVAPGLRPRIVISAGYAWPSTANRPQAVSVRCVVGYGAPDNVPIPLRQWILVMVGHWFENREASVEKGLTALPFIDSLLDPYRVIGIA